MVRCVTDQFPTGEVLDLQDLPRYWAVVDAAYRRARRAPMPPPYELTARRFDESQPAGHRAYIATERYLTVAMDNQRALVKLLEHHGATHSAPWSLLRPAFECGFFAAWVLDPTDGAVRRRRGLQVEVRDEIEQQNHIKAFASVPDATDLVAEAIAQRKARSEASYRRDAQALNVKWDTVRQKVNVVDELRKIRFLQPHEPGVRATFIATWRMLSGFEHGLGWAMLRGSNAKRRAEIPGGHVMELSMKDDAFVTAGKCTAWLMLEAAQRLE
ncbi:MAG: hypothetical protein CMH83_03870 [Nocardioides sp.]|nr:hypothetical protein [Nocardioides sp.]